MTAPSRPALALFLTATALGLAACGDDAGVDQLRKDAAEQKEELRDKARDAARDVEEGRKSAEDAAAEFQEDAERLGEDAREQIDEAQRDLENATP